MCLFNCKITHFKDTFGNILETRCHDILNKAKTNLTEKLFPYFWQEIKKEVDIANLILDETDTVE